MICKSSINVLLAGGAFYSNRRAGRLNLDPGKTWSYTWTPHKETLGIEDLAPIWSLMVRTMLEFDPAVHEAQLKLFDACFAVREGNALPLDTFIKSTDCKEAKGCVYANRRMVAAFIGALHEQGMDDRAEQSEQNILRSSKSFALDPA